MPIAPGSRLGPYEILAAIGGGGMGEVFLARDTRLDRPVAIKVLRGHLSSRPEVRLRFQREARAASALNHPHICTVYDVGEHEGEPYLVLEHLEGETLRDVLQRGPAPMEMVVRVARDVADALAAAHQRGIIHRDVKPENVFLTTRGEAKLMDFGLAAFLPDGRQSTVEMLTEAGTAPGTLAYMSPEQARGEQLDWRTDIFSFGVMAYEMAAGERPFRGNTTASLFDAILRGEPAPIQKLRPDTTAPLAAVIGASLAKAREERSVSAGDIVRLLEGTAAPGLAAPPKGRMHTWIAGAAMLTIVLAWLLYRSMAGPGEIRSLAVLPFRADQTDGQDLASGLTESLIEEVSGSEGLRVAPRAASFRDVGKEKPAEEVGRELGVDGVLEGRIGREGVRMWIRANLVDARSGKAVWQRRYDPERNEVYAVRNRLASDVRAFLKVRPTRAASGTSGQSPANPEAFDYYLRGLAHTWRWSRQDTEAAIPLLEKSVALDPNFTPTNAALALVYGTMAFNYQANDPQWEEKGFAAARRALSADPDSPEAHYAQAAMLWRISHAFPAKEALAELRKALSAKPSFDEAWHLHGVILFHVGHLEAGRRDIDQALSLNPASVVARFRYAPILNYLGRYEDALAAVDRVPRESYPSQWAYHRAWSLVYLGRLDEAASEVERAMEFAPNDEGGVLHASRAMIRVLKGDRKGAEGDIATAVRVGKNFGHFHHTSYSIATVYAHLGEVGKALEFLETTARSGFPNFPLFESDPHLAKLRGVPKFEELLKRLRREWEHIPGEE